MVGHMGGKVGRLRVQDPVSKIRSHCTIGLKTGTYINILESTIPSVTFQK